MFTTFVAGAFLLASVHAVDSAPTNNLEGLFGLQGCPTDGLQFSPIPNQAAFVPPTTSPSFVYAAVGVQNYTCNTSTGAYTSAGAVAELFDATCILKIPGYSSASISDELYKVWTAAPESLAIQNISSFIMAIKPELSSGQHYFIGNKDGGISPIWDDRASGTKTRGNSDAFVIGKVASTVTAPTGPQDVNWLRLDNVEGHLATTVFRTDTRGGQPPASCVNGGSHWRAISIKYASFYFLYGSSL